MARRRGHGERGGCTQPGHPGNSFSRFGVFPCWALCRGPRGRSVLLAGIPRGNSGGSGQVLLGRGLKVAGECGSSGLQETIHEEENR
jgi:hypothetical protein